MSVIVKKNSEENVPVPDNYVRCSKAEAIQHQWSMIREWQPQSDIWPFKQGPAALGFAASLSSGLIASFIRLKLNLRHFGRAAMLLPTMAIPGVLSPLLNLKLVGEPVMIQSECPVCLQLRSMLIQAVMAVGYPTIMASGTGIYLAERYTTYRLPEFTLRALPQFINISKSLLVPYKNNIVAITILNVLFAGFITDRQANSIFTIARKLEEEVDELS